MAETPSPAPSPHEALKAILQGLMVEAQNSVQAEDFDAADALLEAASVLVCLLSRREREKAKSP